MKISKQGLDLIKKYEGFSSIPYLCPAKKATIGYGNTYWENGKKVSLFDSTISEQRASELLEFIVKKDVEYYINTYVLVPLSQNQYDALCSFIYNVGQRNFRRSTLLKKLNRYDYIGATQEFIKWRRSGGRVLRGLILRRKEERELFLS